MKNTLIHKCTILILALLMAVGQFKIERIIPNFPFIGRISISIPLILLIITLSFFYKEKFNKEKKGSSLKLPSVIILWAFILIIVNISIDLISNRSINYYYNINLIIISLTSLLIYKLVNNFEDFYLLINNIVIVSIMVGAIDFLLWNFYREIQITQISSSRLFLIGLGASLFLLINELKFKHIAYFVLTTFFIINGSLKIGFIGLFIFLVIAISMLLINKMFKMSIILIGIISISSYFSYANNLYSNVFSRVKYVEFSSHTSNSFNADKVLPPSSIERFLIQECAKSSNFNFCISDEIKIKDVTERIRLWSHALQLIRNNPLVGVGEHGYQLRLAYRYASGNNIYDYSYPHNIFFNAAVLYGLPYMILEGLLIYFCFISSIYFSIRRPAIIGLLAGGGAILTSSMTGGDIYDARYIFFMATLACVYSSIADIPIHANSTVS